MNLISSLYGQGYLLNKRNQLITRLLFLGLLLTFLIPCSCQKPEDNPGVAEKPELSEILSRPAESSVTVNVMSDVDCEVFWEYGTSSGSYPMKTSTRVVGKDGPVESVIDNLSGATRYYYRSRFRNAGSSEEFYTGPEHSFQTSLPPGNTFRFAVEADPHIDYNSDTAAYNLTLGNIASENPDFLIDLGDTFMSEKLPAPITFAEITSRHLLLRSFFDNICHSVPLFLVLGNHEGELGWLKNGTSSSLPVTIINIRKKYFSNPVPDGFYSGNTTDEPFVGLNQNYYAWEWGEALFIVLDPFWYTTVKSGWGYTLGKAQYDWFKEVLEASDAKFRFVFCHNLVGGYGGDARGGAEYADLFEMGGYNTDGTWGFDTNRPGWGKPLHTLMKENNVNVFFHGHDHFYGKQEKDGIIYQEVPQPSNRNITNISAAEYGYTYGELLPGRGYLLVTVNPAEVSVEYIGTFLPNEETAARKNRSVLDAYTLN